MVQHFVDSMGSPIIISFDLKNAGVLVSANK